MGEDGRDGRGCAHRLTRVLEALKRARVAKKTVRQSEPPIDQQRAHFVPLP
jgi:uncharacterized protein YggE